MFKPCKNNGKFSPRTELRKPRSLTPSRIVYQERGLKLLPPRPITANPLSQAEPLAQHHQQQSRSLSQKVHQPLRPNKTSGRGPLKAQALPELNMEPLTVSLLPHTGKKKIGKKPHISPLRSPRSASPRGNPFPISGTESIQLLRPNKTKIDLQKIDLDRRGLSSWPSSAMTESPRLLSLQFNQLTTIDPPFQMSSLVLLDLYHNQLKSLSGLQFVPNLKILLLAKNRLSRIEGLEHVTRLEVLDLHGNQILHINGLSNLKELKLLNLAGNMLRHVTNMKGLESLTELNLKRNQIRTVTDLHFLPNLEKVFLSFNEICRYEDILSLQKCSRLRELSLDENPISKNSLYFHNTAIKFYRIKRLDDQELTVESRRLSERFIQKSKEKEKAKAAQITDDEKRKIAINSAMRHWRTLKAAQYMIIRKKHIKGEEECEEEDREEDENKTEEKVPSSEDDKSILEVKKGEENPPAENSFSEIPKICEPDPTQQEDPSDIKTIPEIVINAVSPKSFLEIPNSNPQSKRKFIFNRSKSSVDIKFNSIKTTNDSTGSSRELLCNAVSQKTLTDTLQTSNPGVLGTKSTPKVTRRHSESRLVLSQNSVSGVPISGKTKHLHSENLNEKKPLNLKPPKILQKSASSINLKSTPDRGLTATVSKIQTNLNRLHKNSDVKSNVSHNSSLKSKQDDKGYVSDSSDEDSGSEYISMTSSSSAVYDEKSHTDTKSLVSTISRPTNKVGDTAIITDRTPGGVFREQGPNFLAELENKVLRLYGSGALKCTELVWDKSATMSATCVYFQYINYDEIVEIFHRLRIRFPRLENFVFIETNLTKCSQLNALAELHQVTSIQVKPEGNPLVKNPYWRHYAIFRLAHWGLMSINEIEITDDERQEANCMFSSLSQIAFTCLPRQQLNVLISSRQPQSIANTQTENSTVDNNISDIKEENYQLASEGPNLTNITTPHLQELIGKEALQYRPLSKLSEEEVSTLTKSSASTIKLMNWGLESVQRSSVLEKVWPSVLHDLTRDSITDLIKPNYGKSCLDNLKKDLGWKK